MKKTISRILTLALALTLALSLAACGGTSNSGNGSTTTPPANSTTNPPASTPSEKPADNAPSGNAEWPADDEFAKQVPKPDGTIIAVSLPKDDDDYFLAQMDWTKEQAKAYVEELKASGYETINELENETYEYAFVGEKGEYRVDVMKVSDYYRIEINKL